MIIINESPILVDAIYKYKQNKPDITYISTKGFLNDYYFYNGKIEYRLKYKQKELIQQLSEMKNETIVIATDHDKAGMLIAWEIMDYLDVENNDIFRFTLNFDELLYIRYDKDFILNNISEEEELEFPKMYLYTKLQESIVEKKNGMDIDQQLLAILPEQGKLKIELHEDFFKEDLYVFYSRYYNEN